MLKYKPFGTFLVTGSSSGIGKAIADLLVSSGTRVIYHSKSPHDLEIPDHCKYVVADLSRESEADRLAVESGEVDGLVCCAGRTHLAGPNDTSLIFNKTDYQQIFDNVLVPTVLICTRIVPGMIAKRKGRVVIIGGDVVDRPNPNSGMCCYAMAKAAVHQYGVYLATKVKDSNVTVNVVAPTGIEERVSQATLNRKGTRSELAEFVKFLCSEESSYLTGQIVRFNGGKLSY